MVSKPKSEAGAKPPPLQGRNTLEAYRLDSASQFRIGDAVIKDCGPSSERGIHDSSAAMIKTIVEELLERGFETSVATLSIYREVSTKFPKEIRTRSLPWSIYKAWKQYPAVLIDKLKAVPDFKCSYRQAIEAVTEYEQAELDKHNEGKNSSEEDEKLPEDEDEPLPEDEKPVTPEDLTGSSSEEEKSESESEEEESTSSEEENELTPAELKALIDKDHTKLQEALATCDTVAANLEKYGKLLDQTQLNMYVGLISACCDGYRDTATKLPSNKQIAQDSTVISLATRTRQTKPTNGHATP